jgi:hypothetical protein
MNNAIISDGKKLNLFFYTTSMANSQPLSYDGLHTFPGSITGRRPITFTDYSRLYPSTMQAFSIAPDYVPEKLNDQEQLIAKLALELKTKPSVTIPGVKNPVKNFIKYR